MLRSLFSGVSGMKTQQTKMDVIGNNIANSSTTAFKSSNVTFEDMLSQTMQDASSPASANPQDSIGGTNPKQVGLGVAVAKIGTDLSQGALQPTGISTDMAIQGNGYFIVAPAQADPSATPPVPHADASYTRDGSFTLDSQGYLVTANGQHVLGAMVALPATTASTVTLTTTGATPQDVLDAQKAIQIPLTNSGSDLKSFSIDKDGTIKAIYDSSPVIVGQIAVASFQNPEGLVKEGNNLFKNSSNSGDPTVGEASVNGNGTIEQGFLEASNVDLANEFTEMIITSRAFQANSKTITTSDDMLQTLIGLIR